MNPEPTLNLHRPASHRVWLAGVLSLLLPGAGQILCRQDNKGVFLIGIFLIGHWLTGGISSLILCPAMMLDACMIAGKINRGSAVKRWEFFPAIKRLNALDEHVVPLAIVALIVLITLIRLVIYGSD